MKNYEEGNLEDSDSDGDIYLDGGSDGTGHDIVHGGMGACGLVKSEE